jgi:enoyl-CoA hydratase
MLKTEDRDGVRILALARGKANVLDTGFAIHLDEAARAAEADAAVRGVVLTSASPAIFCGGFDLVSLGPADPGTFEHFLRAIETLFFDLFLLKKPLVAALTGHAIAGGAIVAAAADFRFAAEGKGTIGLPEATLGMHVPRACVEAMRATVGDRALNRWALGGDPTPFAEAKELGALDRIVPPERLLDEAVGFARHLGRSDGAVYATIKRDLRRPALERAQAVLEDGRKAFLDSWFSEIAQKGIAATLARLK